MTINALYLNFIKFVTMAFVLAFTAYVSQADEVIFYFDQLPVCEECIAENPGNESEDAETNEVYLSNLELSKPDSTKNNNLENIDLNADKPKIKETVSN